MRNERCNRIANVAAPALLLLVVCGMIGCVSFPSLDHIMEFPRGLTASVAAYRHYTGRWPSSLDDLRSLDGKVPDEELGKEYSAALSTFPWDQLEGKTTFKAMPDGSLTVSLPPLHLFWSDKKGSVEWNPEGMTYTFGVPVVPKDESAK